MKKAPLVMLPIVLMCALAASGSDTSTRAVLRGRSDGLIPAVSVVVKGKPMWFDLDTGALVTIMDSSAATALGLRVKGNTTLRGAGSGAVTAARLGTVPMQLGDVTYRARDVLAVDLSHAGSVLKEGGILGFDFFESYVVEVNFDSYVVTLHDPRTYHYRGNGVAVPLIIRAPRAYVDVTVSARGLAPEHHELRLDSGSSDSVDDDIILRSSAPKRAITGGVGIGKRFRTYLGTVSSMTIGPFTMHDLPSATGSVQLIGDDIWHRFNIVFDFRHSVMYLTPRPDQDVFTAR